jgi:hypothetical protein
MDPTEKAKAGAKRLLSPSGDWVLGRGFICSLLALTDVRGAVWASGESGKGPPAAPAFPRFEIVIYPTGYIASTPWGIYRERTK